MTTTRITGTAPDENPTLSRTGVFEIIKSLGRIGTVHGHAPRHLEA
jgi:hypothetical protein